MRLQMLISSLNANPNKLIQGMKPECEGILVNQCEEESEEEIQVNGYRFLVLNKKERGVGRSRNAALAAADAELIIFSDDDIVYDTGYAEAVMKAFRENPKADLLLFNVRVCEERRTYWNKDCRRIRWYNCGRFPAYSIAARREALVKSGVKYSELFGGGAKYSNGEDSLFLRSCAGRGLKLYTTPVCIGEEIPRESTWFHGYTEKFFFDRGVLFAFLYGNLAPVWAIRFVLTKRGMLQGEIRTKKAFQLILAGIKEGKREKRKA